MSSRDFIDRSNYLSDSRVRAGERSKDDPIKHIDTSRMLATVEIPDPDENEENENENGGFTIEVQVPVKFEVCPTCEGKGTHVNPSVDAGGLTAEDFAEDPDFAEEYMSGTYDVGCYECKGERVVPVIDRERADPKVIEALDKQAEDRAQYRAEVEAERRMGC
jgi:hypothetical protein